MSVLIIGIVVGCELYDGPRIRSSGSRSLPLVTYDKPLPD